MSLRKSPTRTEAFLAANRRNAQKSTGPRTSNGKSAIVFNSIRHGFRSRRLFETLSRASLSLQLDFARIYAALYRASQPGLGQTPWVLPAAAYIWRLKRLRERWAQLPGFAAAVGLGIMPRPWRWRAVNLPGPPGKRWRVTATVWVRRSRARAGERWWTVDPAVPRPVHVGVTIYRSDGKRWERVAVTSRRPRPAAASDVPLSPAANDEKRLLCCGRSSAAWPAAGSRKEKPDDAPSRNVLRPQRARRIHPTL